MIVTFDFETFYSQDFTLRKMTPVEYILNPQFEVIGCAVKVGRDEPVFMDEREFRRYLAGIDANEVTAISHNALFDMCILAWKFGFVPKLMIDTLGMSRALLAPYLRSLSLDSVSKYLKLPHKGDTVHKVIGMTARMIREAGIWDEYAKYSCDDANIAYAIFEKLMKRGFPQNELLIMDMVLRCAVMPSFRLDTETLYQHLGEVMQAKADLMAQVTADRSTLMSNDMFAQALKDLGVDPPTKTSLATGKETWAFSKQDVDFNDLQEHPDPRVQALVAARLGIKSTLEETRTQRLISISQLEWGGMQRRFMPIPLKYSGAITHRLSGDWKLNMQNLPRGGNLRKALVVPTGYKVIAVDASQIEARLVSWFAGQLDLTEAFANGEDVYSLFASSIYGFPVNKRDNPIERYVGKQCILGLGYGLGWKKFIRQLRVVSRNQTGQEIILSEEDGQRIVGIYREKYYMIPMMWRVLNAQLPLMTRVDHVSDIKCVSLRHEHIMGPSGLPIRYSNLRYEEEQWKYDFSGKTKRIYGGAALENIIQYLARIHVMDAALRVRRALEADGHRRVRLALQAHDELVYVAPASLAQYVHDLVLAEMNRRPAWGLDAPLTAEGGIGDNYSDAK